MSELMKEYEEKEYDFFGIGCYPAISKHIAQDLGITPSTVQGFDWMLQGQALKVNCCCVAKRLAESGDIVTFNKFMELMRYNLHFRGPHDWLKK